MTAYRLFHGETEGIPGLAIDRYGQSAVIHADSPDLLHTWSPELRPALTDFDAAYARIHPRDATRLGTAELRRFAPADPLWGHHAEETTVIEGGVRYAIRFSEGLSVGLFLDMREVRPWLRQATAGRTVLNLFAYTCSFGVCAALGGAARVLNLDLSRSYLEWGKANYRLNELGVEDRDFVYGDAFDWLRRFTRRGQRFDMVIVDPPSFSSTPFSVTRDYARLIEASARVVGSPGILVAATNHAGTSDERFETWLHQGLALAERHGQLTQRWHEPQADFPVPAGRQPFLKVRALVVD